MKLPARARVSLYSGRYRPACRISQIGVYGVGSRFNARRKVSLLSMGSGWQLGARTRARLGARGVNPRFYRAATSVRPVSRSRTASGALDASYSAARGRWIVCSSMY